MTRESSAELFAYKVTDVVILSRMRTENRRHFRPSLTALPLFRYR